MKIHYYSIDDLASKSKNLMDFYLSCAEVNPSIWSFSIGYFLQIIDKNFKVKFKTPKSFFEDRRFAEASVMISLKKFLKFLPKYICIVECDLHDAFSCNEVFKNVVEDDKVFITVDHTTPLCAGVRYEIYVDEAELAALKFFMKLSNLGEKE